jgi:hypothetical protein
LASFGFETACGRAFRPFQKTNHPNNRDFPRKKHPVWDGSNPGTTLDDQPMDMTL